MCPIASCSCFSRRGDAISHGRLDFEVLEMDGSRILRLEVHLRPEQADAQAEAAGG